MQSLAASQNGNGSEVLHVAPCLRSGLSLFHRACIDIFDELDYPIKPRLLVVVHSHVAAFGAVEVAAFLDFGCHHVHVVGVHGVETGADGEGGDGDLVEVGGAIPVQKSAAGTEFTGTLHQHVDLRVEMLEGTVDRIGPLVGGHSQNVVDIVVRHQQFHVAGLFKLARSFDPLDLREGSLIHLRHQHLFGILVVGGDTGHHVGDDEAFEVLLILESVFHRQDATPGVAEEVEVVFIELERPADLLNLLNKTGGLPKLWLIRLIAVVGA